MIFEAEMLTALAAELVTMVSSFRPPPEGRSRFSHLWQVSWLTDRASPPAFPDFSSGLTAKQPFLGKDFPLTVAGAAAALTMNLVAPHSLETLSGTIGSITIDKFRRPAIAFATH
jgi:hypothetical protein